MISDADLVRILEKSDYEVSTEIKKIMFQRGTGVTKRVWYGNRKIRANTIIHGKVFYSRAWIPRGSGNQ
ncbi:hypothetical protein [Lactococcus garvieae]|uniref:hypothetical protein n=1 Tax=Lactococcus garvieae TaxID=1363 RepID=UPI0009C0E796|nr:hypothetical protein [Lactococcus garvieae]